MNTQLGKYIILAGLAIVVVGIIIYFFSDKLNWIGRLPGDIRVQKDNFRPASDFGTRSVDRFHDAVD